jgi:glycosyltransferase involved in cell wall biosynthesis
VRRAAAWDLVRVAAGAAGAREVMLDRLWERSVLAFDRGVASRLGPPTGLVYGYEHACRATFERAEELGMHRVFDMASPHYALMARVLDAEHAQYPELLTEHARATRPLAGARNAHKQAELDGADLVIANSTLTARSLTETGYPSHKVRVVPRGGPPVDSAWRALRPPDGSSPVQVLFAGHVSVRKGGHLLLQAWQRLAPRAGAELWLAGPWLLPERLGKALPPSVRALGSLPQAELFRAYASASVLVFPTLLDGFGMVAAEALAHGLPVITTDRAGAADLITEGQNGFVLPAGDVDALSQRLEWCLSHPVELFAMREAAEQRARSNQWSDYRASLLATLRSFFAG